MASKKNIRHTSDSPKWGTSPEAIEVIHHVLGYVSVDPFSEPEFNQHMRADRILTGEKGLDGFADRWLDLEEAPRADWLLTGMSRKTAEGVGFTLLPTAVVNPPGDDQGINAKRAWYLLNAYHALGWFPGGAIWVGFTLNQFQTLQLKNDVTGFKREGFRSPLHADFKRCIPDHRLAYTPHSTSIVEDDAPSHPSFLVLLPSTIPMVADRQVALFREHAGKLGEVF